jgi:hypothetical protein
MSNFITSAYNLKMPASCCVSAQISYAGQLVLLITNITVYLIR